MNIVAWQSVTDLRPLSTAIGGNEHTAAGSRGEKFCAVDDESIHVRRCQMGIEGNPIDSVIGRTKNAACGRCEESCIA